MVIALILTSALFAAMQNLCMRRSVDTGGGANLYVPIQLFISALIATLLNPVSTGDYGINISTVVLGVLMGSMMGLLMWSLGKSLKFGSPALTFAVVNSCSVLPAVLMAFVFGKGLGHPYHWWNGMGSLVVVIGIFWSSWAAISCTDKKRWALFMASGAAAFILFSAMLQWKVLLETHGGTHWLLPVKISAENNQFLMPIIFLCAALMQLLGLRGQPLHFSKETAIYGLLGGICNGSSLFFMMMSTSKAVGIENAILFPLFSIAVIQICNLWGRALYQEKIQWTPQTLCIGGLVLGSVYWPQIFS